MVQRYHMTRRGRLTGLMAMFILLLSGTSATAQYCIPNAVPGWGGYGGIRRVQMNNLDVTSPFCNANCYFNTGATGDILRQVPTQIRVEAQDGNTQNFQVSVWIDVNQDGQWQNPAERFAAGTITTNFALDPNGNWTFISNPFIGTITLPCTTLLGQTRMRVRMTLGFAGDGPGPCDPYIGGVQDFNVVVGGDVVATFPDDVTDAVGLLPRGIYDGQNNTQRPSVTMRVGAPNQSFNVTYRIQGPLPGTNIVYQGHQVGNPNATTFSVSGPTSGTFPQLFTFNVPAARFSLAGTNGALDARFAIGGEYQVIVTASSTAGCFSEWAKTFTIAVDRDISTRLIRSPRTNEPPSRFKYPNTVGIPVEAVFQNAGLFNVEEFRAIATITDPNGVVAYRDTVNVVQELTPRQRATVTFRNYTANPQNNPPGHLAGLHRLSICAELITPFPDENTFNDCLPRAIDPAFQFEVGYNEEAGVEAITVPSVNQTNLYAGRPLRPEAVFNNGGIQDLTNVPVRLVIRKLPAGNVVYTRDGIVPDIGAGQFNKAVFVFEAFTPTESGDYEFCFSTRLTDPVPGNNSLCQVFTFKPALNGIYTIGTTNQTSPRNFPTFDSALNELYRAGITGPVTFELTDANYTVTSNNINAAAIDLSSRILGASATNSITFKPSLQRSLTRGSINLRLRAGSGVGVLFGQNAAPANPNAIQNQLYFTSATNANSSGFITWDGGSQKSIRVTVERSVATPSPFLAAFYLNSGSTNINVRNILIEHSTFATRTYANTLPVVRYNGGSQEFRFDPNTVSTNVSFTAGIVNRDTVAVFNQGNLDTIVNVNNQFIQNEITGFGYGVVSMGLGVLIKAGVNEFRGYYNTGTRIENNIIHTVGRAGIFVGYEDGVSIVGNRIYNVGVGATGVAVADAAGIIAGGETRYNNVDLNIQRNEISGVRGNAWSRGIVVEQVRNDFQSVVQAGGLITYPNRPEHSMVTGNAVWGISRGTTTANMAGIHLWTRRAVTTDPILSLVQPFANTYFTRNDTIGNNTVVMSNDNIVGAGAVVGVGSQHGNGTVIMNNAIALLGASNAAATAHSAILYEGTLFRGSAFNTDYLSTNAPAALVSNRNAFHAPNAGIARFIEISETSELVAAGDQTEFQTIAQWRNWTKQDINSSVGDFVAEHEFQGIAPNQRLRVKVTPQAPIGSILNNRGERINSLTVDIDGNIRGEAGTGYDIGADEFNGRLYITDLEVVDILSPASYRRLSGTTSDAEYVMTKAPIDVQARTRNNGALAVTNARVRLRIFMETVNSNNTNAANPTFNLAPIVDRTLTADMASGALRDLTFSNLNWTPTVYFGLTGYTTPTRFASMAANVTPRYRIEVSVPSDENMGNNVQSKVVRFYIQKSQMNIIVSTRHSDVNILSGTPTGTQIAGRLNGDSLMKSMADLGWRNDPANNSYAYDVFERGAWEERAVNYNIYRSMFWAHDQSALTRTERDDIRNFIKSGSPQNKKNLAIGSQELPRRHIGLNVINDESFVRTVLRATNAAPGTPVPPPTNSYHNRRITGSAIARNSTETVVRTGFNGDADPVPALVRLYSDATTSGLANPAYFYRRGDRTTTDSIMGTAVAGLNVNTVYLGVDWRHYNRPEVRTGGERVLRGIIDFFETNGGTVVPVELASFDAQGRGNDVDVFWSTASEANSDRFEVERATVSETGTSEFALVTTVPAAGNTTERRDYRVADKDLAAGTYLYRLHMVDIDGSSARSQEVEVTVGDTRNLWISTITPNPVTTAATVEFGSAVTVAGDVKLYNMAGQEVVTMFVGEMIAGQPTTAEFNAANLPSGVYTIVVRAGEQLVSKTVNIVR